MGFGGPPGGSSPAPGAAAPTPTPHAGTGFRAPTPAVTGATPVPPSGTADALEARANGPAALAQHYLVAGHTVLTGALAGTTFGGGAGGDARLLGQ
jgi:hypothetical protein